jgi:exonuclease V gamma subunit
LPGAAGPLDGGELDIQGRHARHSLRVPPARTLDGWLVDYRLSKLRVKHRLGAWLRCLALSALHPDFAGLRLIMKDGSLELTRHPAPLPVLADLLDLHWEGLSEALPLLPESSFAAARAALGNSKVDPLAAAWTQWDPGNGFGAGEGADPWNRLAFPRLAPLDDPRFLDLARRLWEPWCAHMGGCK